MIRLQMLDIILASHQVLVRPWCMSKLASLSPPGIQVTALSQYLDLIPSLIVGTCTQETSLHVLDSNLRTNHPRGAVANEHRLGSVTHE